MKEPLQKTYKQRLHVMVKDCILSPSDQGQGKDVYLTALVQHSAISSHQGNRARKGNKRHLYQKERNKTVPFFAVDMILFIENPKESTKPTRMNKPINFRIQNEHSKINCTSMYWR